MEEKFEIQPNLQIEKIIKANEGNRKMKKNLKKMYLQIQ
jgi:hypothetical protein